MNKIENIFAGYASADTSVQAKVDALKGVFCGIFTQVADYCPEGVARNEVFSALESAALWAARSATGRTETCTGHCTNN